MALTSVPSEAPITIPFQRIHPVAARHSDAASARELARILTTRRTQATSSGHQRFFAFVGL